MAKGPTGKKVVVFYSSLGKGHEIAAKQIEAAVLADNPDNEVVKKDIRELTSGIKEVVDRKLYLFIVKNFPGLFDGFFRSHLANGQSFKRFQAWSKFYDKEAVADYLKQQQPDVIVSTHYGAAEVTAALRERGLIRDIPVGWMHTDYFLGYFHRISKAIDRTFLPHAAMTESWAENDVPLDRVVATGLPVSTEVYDAIDADEARAAEKIDPRATVVTLSSGGEGIGDYEAMVKSLVEKLPARPLEIYAVCGANETNFNRLTELAKTLPSDVRLHISKFIPQKQLFQYIKMADVYVTKAGGMSPTEGFAFQRPMVVLDNFGGHERINARFFAERHLALVIQEESNLGSEVRRLLSDVSLQRQMKVAQAEFRRSLTLDPVVDFVRSGQSTMSIPRADFGTPLGSEVKGADVALDKLDAEAPADVEILLSYSSYPNDKLLVADQNPFGHIAIAIDGEVYTVNSLAVPGADSGLVSAMTLREYLYSLVPQEVNEYPGSNFGSAYSRDVIGLRIRGISGIIKSRMKASIKLINEKFERGECTYKNKGFNCANAVANILEGVGLGFKNPDTTIAFPLDIFDEIYETMISDPTKDLSLVSYQQTHDSKAQYHSSRFPLSPYQPARLLRTVRKREDFKIFPNLTHRVIHYAGDDRVVFENMAGPNPITQYRDPMPEEDYRVGTWFGRRALRDFKLIQEMEKTIFSSGFRPSEALSSFENGTMSDEQWRFYSGHYGEMSDLIDSYAANMLRSKVLLARSRLMTVYRDLPARIPPGEFDKIKKLLGSAIEKSDYFLMNADEVRKPKIVRDRSFAAKGFFDDVETITERVEALKIWPVSTPKKANKIFARLVDSIRIAWEHIAQIPTIASLTFEVLAKREGSLSNPLPVVRAINRQFIRQAHVRGSEMKIENEKWLASTPDSKEITLIVPTHREALNDVRLQAQLMGDRDHYIFMAPDNFAPEWLGDHVEKIKGLVTVGRGSDKPIESLISQLKERSTNTVVIYPEGSTDAGLGETRPPRMKFASGLIRRLHDEGYKVRLVPVSYDYEVRALGLGEEEVDRLKAFVHKPIEDAVIRRFVKTPQGEEELLNFLRMIWLEGINSTDRSLMGMVRPHVADATLDEVFSDPNVKALSERSPLKCEVPLRRLKAKADPYIAHPDLSYERLPYAVGQ